MTPEQAQEIYHQARVKAYEEFADHYKPAEQQAVILAGFQAVIDAVRIETESRMVREMLEKGAV